MVRTFLAATLACGLLPLLGTPGQAQSRFVPPSNLITQQTGQGPGTAVPQRYLDRAFRTDSIGPGPSPGGLSSLNPQPLPPKSRPVLR